jgi:hypothetical protein
MITDHVNTDIPPGPDAGPEDIFRSQVRVQHPARTYTNDPLIGFVEVGGVQIKTYRPEYRSRFKQLVRDSIDALEADLALGVDPAVLRHRAVARVEKSKETVLAAFLELEAAERAHQHAIKAVESHRAQQFANS